VTRNNNLN